MTRRAIISIPICLALVMAMFAIFFRPASLIRPKIALGDSGHTGRSSSFQLSPTRNRLPESDYKKTSSDLFGMPALVPSSPAPKSPKPAVFTQMETADPLADFMFTGAVTLKGKVYALIENRRTKDGEYVAAGEDFHGFRVSAIETTGIVLQAANEQRRIALNDNFSLTPFDKSGDKEDVQREKTAEGSLRYYETAFVAADRLAIVDWIGNDVEHLKDQVFEGQMSVDEYNQKVGSQPSATLFLSVRLNAVIDTDVSSEKIYRRSQ